MPDLGPPAPARVAVRAVVAADVGLCPVLPMIPESAPEGRAK